MPRSSKTSASSEDRQSNLTAPTTASNKSARSDMSSRASAYNSDFETILHKNRIYMNDRKAKPTNKPDLSGRGIRSSLSPSRFTAKEYDAWIDKHETVVTESDVMMKIVPEMVGSAIDQATTNVVCNNLSSMTGGRTVNLKPDLMFGSPIEDVESSVEDELESRIVFFKSRACPVANNFFLELKSLGGTADVAKRQVCYAGAHGVRAMHALQDYGIQAPDHHGDPNTGTATYHAGTKTLDLRVHYATEPSKPGPGPDYHMSLVESHCLGGGIDAFRKGVSNLRHLNDWAQEKRTSYINSANTRARAAGQ
ncbi:hypothetical protein QBC44DRAFT_280850 [Cladorrhinum sp. PSN332]|nr:hypothetical protein QBC44DRAFT_280850 [Cladorrhinum sp. PSN332]